MKATTMSSIALLAISAIGAPTASNAYEPEGGWESIDWTKIDYPAGTGENLEHYPAPEGGWENVDYPAGTGENLEHYPAPDCATANGPFTFTSTYHVSATPEQVVNGTTPTGGLAGASATYDLGINAALDLICFHIRLVGFRGEYSSPAATATHIHQAARGASGPPRIAFPNPVGDEREAVSVGCLRGPFNTGLKDVATGQDTGAGFTVAQIEADPGAFFADVHSSLALPGAVRGQIA